MTKKGMIVALVAVAIAWRFAHPAQAPDVSEPTVTDTHQTESQSTADISDAALDRDLSAVDKEINNLDGDLSSIDAGLNDRPIEQES